MISELILKIANQDKNALKELYDISYSKVFSIALNILHNVAAAEDVTQDVFIRVWNKAYLFVPVLNGERWLYRLAKNLSISELRTCKRTLCCDNAMMDLYTKSVEMSFDSYLFKGLDDLERKIVVLKAYEFKNKEIVKILCIELRSIEGIFKSARKKIEKNIK